MCNRKELRDSRIIRWKTWLRFIKELAFKEVTEQWVKNDSFKYFAEDRKETNQFIIFSEIFTFFFCESEVPYFSSSRLDIHHVLKNTKIEFVKVPQ